MKKVLALMLAMVLVLSLAACGGESSSISDNGRESSSISGNGRENSSISDNGREKTVTHEYYSDIDSPQIEKMDSVVSDATFLYKDDNGYWYSLGSDMEHAEAAFEIYFLYLLALDGLTFEKGTTSLYSMKYEGKTIGAVGYTFDDNEYKACICFF